MKLYPKNITNKLGFDLLQQKLDAYTQSRMGQERVEEMQPSSALSVVKHGLRQVSEAQAVLTFDDALPLTSLPDVREVVRFILPEGAFMQPEALLGVGHILGNTRRLKSYLDARRSKYPALHEIANDLQPQKNVERRIGDTVDDTGQIKDDASPELRRIRRRILRIQGELRSRVMSELRRAEKEGFAADDQPTIRNGRLVIPVKAEAKRKITGFLHDVSATGHTAYIEPAAVMELNNDLRELETEERREIERILQAVCAELRTVAPDILNNVEALGLLDFILAKAKLANALGGMVPHVNDRGVFKLKKAKNPMLILRYDQAKKEIVPLDLTLGEQFRSLIITGPNAGGKSVAMKTVGLLALMVAHGIPIPCNGDASDVCLFTGIYADIGDEQSIENDLSTFSSHLTHLRHMLADADGGTLILIDEAGTGTDPAEGAALSQAMLEHFHKVNATVIVTTHHGALKVFAHETQGIENGAMSFDEANITPTYRLQTGIPGSSYAFEMAERLQLPPETIVRARNLMGTQQASFENLLHDFARKNEHLTEQLKALDAEKAGLEASRKKFEERRLHLEQVKDQIRKDALNEAQKVLNQANAEVERTIREIREAQAEAERTKVARQQLEATKDLVKKYQLNLEKRTKAREEQHEAQRQQEVQRQQGAKTTPQKKEQKPIKEASSTICVGDQVVVGEGTTPAEVLEIVGKNALVAQGSMKVKAKLNQLRKVAGPRKQTVTVRHQYSPSDVLSVGRARVHLDIRGQRVEDAKITVTQFLDDAIAANLNRVEILHGTGTGALRMVLKEMLAHYEGVTRFEEAPWDLGGPGVTYVWLA
ncbi:MAG: Smr/MutS family protein [Rhodothermia bacterium]|nr:Smr/MutS family protein [Rhodothermia bacterium]